MPRADDDDGIEEGFGEIGEAVIPHSDTVSEASGSTASESELDDAETVAQR